MIKMLLLSLSVSLMFSGCYNTSSLNRSRRSRQVRKKNVAPPPKSVQRKNQNSSDDPAFDLIFHRKPQEHKATSLSNRESELMRRSAKEDADAMRSVRREKMNDSGQKDWVFGTKNGKYFGR